MPQSPEQVPLNGKTGGAGIPVRIPGGETRGICRGKQGNEQLPVALDGDEHPAGVLRPGAGGFRFQQKPQEAGCLGDRIRIGGQTGQKGGNLPIQGVMAGIIAFSAAEAEESVGGMRTGIQRLKGGSIAGKNLLKRGRVIRHRHQPPGENSMIIISEGTGRFNEQLVKKQITAVQK